MDNARSHHALGLRPFLDNLNVIYSAPYSPFLNPIEEMFGLWKHHYRKINFLNNSEVIDNIYQSSKYLTTEKISKFYRHSLEFSVTFY